MDGTGRRRLWGLDGGSMIPVGTDSYRWCKFNRVISKSKSKSGLCSVYTRYRTDVN